MGWWLAILTTLTLLQTAGLIVLLIWGHKVLEGVESIRIYVNSTEENLALDEAHEQGEFITPDQVPMSPHLHDVIASASHDDDGKVGDFQGRQPWIPPLPPDETA